MPTAWNPCSLCAWTPRRPSLMPSSVGPTAVPTSLPRQAGTARSASLVSGLHGRVPVHTHVHVPFCRLTAEDAGQLQISIISCLKQLFLLLGTNQLQGTLCPCLSLSLGQERAPKVNLGSASFPRALIPTLIADLLWGPNCLLILAFGHSWPCCFPLAGGGRCFNISYQIRSDQSLSCVRLFVTP